MLFLVQVSMQMHNHVPTIGMILVAGITAAVIGGIIAAITRGEGDT